MGLRNWRQRFDPAAPLVFIRPVTFADEPFAPGDPVPPEIPVKFLRRMWDAERIALEDISPPERTILHSTTSRETKIRAAIETLDPSERAHWTGEGKPKVRALERALGFDIRIVERDAAWDDYLAAHRSE